MRTSPLSHVNLEYVDSFEKLGRFMTWLGEKRRFLGVDTETSGFSPERERIRLIQFGDLNRGWAIPWERWSGAALEAIDKYDGPLVLHNSKFDTRMITHHSDIQWPWHRTHDTMAMAHILNPLRLKGLKPLAGQLVDMQAVQAQRLLDDAMSENKWTWATIPIDFPYYWIYAAMDPVLTCYLAEHFMDDIDSKYRDVYDLEMGTTRIIANMESKGARVDLAYAEMKQTQLLTWSGQARDWLRDQHGLDNPNSGVQLLDFFKRNQIEIPVKRTKGGAQSLDKEVLEGIDHIVAETVLKVRHAEKNVGPYFKNFLWMADDNDRVHANIWTMGTRTARMTITEPALQTLPRKDPTVRTAFIPSEGGVLLTCDYDQIEARLTAHFSKDPGLIHAFSLPEDFFCTIAGQIFQEEISKKDPRRQLTKNTVYGKLYGAGIEKMAQTAHVPFQQMEAVVNGFDLRFPGVKQMQRDIANAAQKRRLDEGIAYVTTPTGRVMMSDDDKDYTLTNYLIQCHAAEILKRKIIELDAMGMGPYMILPVHDEIVFDVPEDEAQNALHIINTTMPDLTSYAVPITASADILTSDWGAKYR